MPDVRESVVRVGPGSQVTFRLIGLRDTHRKVEGKIKRGSDFSPLFRAFHPVWQESIRAVFAAEGIPSWPALSPAYAARKEGPSMMRESDRLFASLTEDGGEGIFQVTPMTMRKGSSVPYWHRHQVGWKMPQRPTLVLLPEVRQRLVRGTARFVNRGEVKV